MIRNVPDPDLVTRDGAIDKNHLTIPAAQALTLLIQIRYLDICIHLHAIIILFCPPFAQMFCAK